MIVANDSTCRVALSQNRGCSGRQTLTTNGTNMPLTGSVISRTACRGYTIRNVRSTTSDERGRERTDDLEQKSGRVEQEQGDVQEEEHGFNLGQRMAGVVFQPRKRDVDGTRAHADGELRGK